LYSSSFAQQMPGHVDTLARRHHLGYLDNRPIESRRRRGLPSRVKAYDLEAIRLRRGGSDRSCRCSGRGAEDSASRHPPAPPRTATCCFELELRPPLEFAKKIPIYLKYFKL
jgi:hypothetical protein